MGYTDELLLLSSNQDVSPVRLVTYATNVIDLTVDRDIGVGAPMFFEWTVTAAFDISNGAPGLRFGISTSDSATFASGNIHLCMTGGGGDVAHLESANLPVGMKFYLAIPQTSIGGEALKRYLTASYWQPLWDTTTDEFAAGSVTCRVVAQPAYASRHYPDGI